MEQIFTLKEPIGKITKARDIFSKIKKININYDQENLIVFYLNIRNQIIDKEVLFKGGLSSSILDPKILFRNALLKKANTLIIAHNHPSNNLDPSNSDNEIYSRLKELGKILQLKVLDSIIFNKKEFYSMEEVS